MDARMEAFADCIQDLSREELIELLIEIETARWQDARILKEFRKISTEMSKEYRNMEAELKATKSDMQALEKKYQHVCEHNAVLSKKVFGRSSEKKSELVSGCPEDYLDPLSETIPSEKFEHILPETDVEVKQSSKITSFAKKRKRKASGYKKVSTEHLPTIHVYELDVDKLNALYGQYNWRIFNWHTSSTVEKVPVVYYRKVTHTAVISVGLDHQLVSIAPENKLYPYSLASPSVLSSILYNKFFLGLPLYRQEKDLAQMGFPLSRKTMSSWVLHFSEEIFSLLFDRLCEELRSCAYNQCDETTIEVLRDGRKAGSKSYMWVHTTSELATAHPVVIFCFERTRGTDHLREFYENYSGTITSDAYQSYLLLESESNGRIVHTGCMMHLRRRFSDAWNLLDLKGLSEETIKELPESKALDLIREIYDADEPLKTLSVKERTIRRDREVRPKVDALFTYLESLDLTAPGLSEKLKAAVTYAQNQKLPTYRFLEDGNIPIDNGNAERHIRPFAVGRRNWLFCNTIEGAKASAILYSIVETAVACGANVYQYLKYLLEEIPKHLADKNLKFLEDMLPWSDAYQSYEADKMSRSALLQNPFQQEAPPKTPRKKDRKISAA